MKNFRTLFRKKEFQAFIACLVFLIFSWPILTIFESKGNGFIFFYFFVVWALVIAVLLLIAYGHQEQKTGTTADTEPEA